MPLLRRLSKWLAIVLVVVVLAAVIVVWPVLGVNPLEGDVDHLWELVSNEVQFFVRFPGSRVLDTPLADGLEQEPGYAWLAEIEDELGALTRQIARDVNPNIPAGLIEIDFENDFVAREMAVAGRVSADYAQPRLDNFIVLTRIAWYGRFVSALQRGFVRDQIPDGNRIELVKGYYFKYTLDAAGARQLAEIRTQRGGVTPSNAIYFGRIADVLLISDTPEWIEAALRGGQDTLKADPWFETEFIHRHRADDIELFMRHGLSANFMSQHGSVERGGFLAPVTRILPVAMTGEITVRAHLSADGIAVRFSDNPPPDGFAKVRQPHLQSLYEREKADLRFDLGENGIGRLIPRERTVAAAVLHADPEELVGLILDALPRDDKELFDSSVREVRNSKFRNLHGVLTAVMSDLADTHLVIVHRPTVFEKANFSTYRDPPDAEWTPKGQFTYTLVSKVKDSVAPDKVRDKFFRHLEYLGLQKTKVHKDGKFHLAEPTVESSDYPLLHPAYGVVEGMKYIVVSYTVEDALAVFEAAANPDDRLINDPGFQAAVDQLPAKGSLALVVRGEMLRRSLGDHVREWADERMDTPGMKIKWYNEYRAAGYKDDSQRLTDAIQAETDKYIAEKYPELRDLYERSLEWLDAIDTVGLSVTLGIGPYKQVRAQGFAFFRTDNDDTETTRE